MNTKKKKTLIQIVKEIQLDFFEHGKYSTLCKLFEQIMDNDDCIGFREEEVEILENWGIYLLPKEEGEYCNVFSRKDYLRRDAIAKAFGEIQEILKGHSKLIQRKIDMDL